MSVYTYLYGLKTSTIYGNNIIDKNISDLDRKVGENNRKIEENNREMLKLNNYIKILEEKLSCFFDVDDDFIIEGN